MNIASERYTYDLMNRFIFRYWDETNGAITIAQLLNDTGYEYLVPYLDDFDISRFKFCSSLSKIIFRDFFLSQINHIKEHEQESLEVAKAYFGQMVKGISKILIVDIGWSGTCINALKYFIHTNISRNIEVYGALICASDTQKMANQILHKEIFVYVNSPVQNADLHSMMTGNKQDKKGTDRLHLPLEYLFTAPYPSLIGYARESEGKMFFRRDNNLPNNKNEINLIQRGIFDFNQIFSTYLHDMNIENVAIPPYSAFIALKQTIQNKQYIFDVYRNFLYDALTLPGNQNEYKTLYASLFPEFTSHKSAKIVLNANAILFTSPELTYTGTPQSLLRISKVAIQLGYYPIVWSKRDGPFRVEFEKYNIPVSIVPESQIETKENIKIIKSCRFAFCNTVVTDVYVRVLSNYIGTIWFIREASNMENFLRNNEERRNLLQTYNNIFCVSEYAAKALASYTKKPIHILHNCVEDESDLAVDYLPGTGEKVKFVQFGTMEYRKGYDILIAAYKSLPVEYQNRCEFYFAGGFINSGTSYCEYIFSEMKNIPSFHYLGVVAGSANKIGTLSKMDVVVVASRDESCSLVALEGAMLSKPLIVTENVGAKYMVDRDNGIIVPSNNVMAMCRAIMSMIDRKDELSKMGKASRRNYEERANMKHHAEALKNLFDAMESADKKQLDLPLMNDFVAPQIVISLTSHPPRMNTLAICLQSLVDQDYKEARIVLYLAKSQFPNGDNDLPQEVLNIQKSCDRLEIRWVDVDLKPHKKYFFACQEYENQPIITVDDDVLYAPCMVSELLRSYKKFPHCVSCHRANMIMMRSDKSFRSYKQWQMEYTMLVDTPSYRLIPTGVGGVLYPPHSLPKIAFDVEKIQELCLYTDDLWLKMMCLVNNIPAVLVRNYCLPKLIPETQNSAIWHQNVIRSENDIAMNNITKYVQENIPEWSTIKDTLYCDVK